MKISQIMTTKGVTGTPESTRDEAIRLFEAHAFRHLPVVHKGALVSLISERDIAEATGWKSAKERKALGLSRPTTVREIMRERVVTLTPEHPVEAAASMMVGKRVGAIPILDKQNLFVGIVTTRDLLAAFRKRNPQAEWGVDEASKVSDFMRAKVETASPRQQVVEAAGVCKAKAVRFLPVTESERIVGLVSDHDLRFAFEGEVKDTVDHVMVTQLVTISPEEALTRAADSMLENNLSALPVVRDDTLVGMLTDEDIIQHCTSRHRFSED